MRSPCGKNRKIEEIQGRKEIFLLKNAFISARVKTGLNHPEKGAKYFSRIPEIFYHNG